MLALNGGCGRGLSPVQPGLLLVAGCLHWCMQPDMAHAGPLVNEVALQWVFNMLLLQREQQEAAGAQEGSTSSWGGRGSSDPGFEN